MRNDDAIAASAFFPRHNLFLWQHNHGGVNAARGDACKVKREKNFVSFIAQSEGIVKRNHVYTAFILHIYNIAPRLMIFMPRTYRLPVPIMRPVSHCKSSKYLMGLVCCCHYVKGAAFPLPLPKKKKQQKKYKNSNLGHRDRSFVKHGLSNRARKKGHSLCLLMFQGTQCCFFFFGSFAVRNRCFNANFEMLKKSQC